MPFKGQTITKTLVTHIKNTELILKKKKLHRVNKVLHLTYQDQI